MNQTVDIGARAHLNCHLQPTRAHGHDAGVPDTSGELAAQLQYKNCCDECKPKVEALTAIRVRTNGARTVMWLGSATAVVPDLQQGIYCENKLALQGFDAAVQMPLQRIFVVKPHTLHIDHPTRKLPAEHYAVSLTTISVPTTQYQPALQMNALSVRQVVLKDMHAGNESFRPHACPHAALASPRQTLCSPLDKWQEKRQSIEAPER